MKKSLFILFAACLTFNSLNANAQIMRGESAAGVYVNTALDSVGNQKIVGTVNSGVTASGAPVRIGLTGRTSNISAVANGAAVDSIATVVGAQINKAFSVPELDWSYVSPAGGILTTADTAISSGAGVGIRNYITGCQFQNAAAVATEIHIKDGTTIIWRGYLQANGSVDVDFSSPIKTTANTSAIVAVGTATTLYVNCQGYKAP